MTLPATIDKPPAAWILLAEREPERMLMRIRVRLAEIAADRPGAGAPPCSARRHQCLRPPPAPSPSAHPHPSAAGPYPRRHALTGPGAGREPGPYRGPRARTPCQLDAESRFVLTRTAMGVVGAGIFEEGAFEDGGLEAESLRLMMAALQPEGRCAPWRRR